MADAAAGGATKSSAKSAKSDAQKWVSFCAAPAVANLLAAARAAAHACAPAASRSLVGARIATRAILRVARALRGLLAQVLAGVRAVSREPLRTRLGHMCCVFPGKRESWRGIFVLVAARAPREAARVAARGLRVSLALPALSCPSSARARREGESKGSERCCVCGHASTHASPCGDCPALARHAHALRVSPCALSAPPAKPAPRALSLVPSLPPAFATGTSRRSPIPREES